MSNASEKTGSGADDEDAESAVVDQEEEAEEEAKEEATPANILTTLAAIEQEENRDAPPDDNEPFQHPLGLNATDTQEPPEGVPTEYCPDCGYESNKGKFKHKSKRSKKFCTMSGSAYADKYVGPHTHGQPAPSDYVYVEKGPNSVWHEPEDPLFMRKLGKSQGNASGIAVKFATQLANSGKICGKDLSKPLRRSFEPVSLQSTQCTMITASVRP